MSGDPHVTFLEMVQRLYGDFRRTLEPIRVTSLQAGVLLYLHRCVDARVNEAASHLQVSPPTMTEVIQDLVRKRWVIKRRSVADGRAFQLRLSRRGEEMTRAIQHQVGQMEARAETLQQVQPTV